MALVNEAIASAKSSSMKKRKKGIMGENKSKKLKSDDENEAYDITLTEQVNMYRALSADICHLEKYVAKAKSRKMDVRRSLENLGISGDILEGDKEVHYGIINIPSKPMP